MNQTINTLVMLLITLIVKCQCQDHIEFNMSLYRIGLLADEDPSQERDSVPLPLSSSSIENTERFRPFETNVLPKAVPLLSSKPPVRDIMSDSFRSHGGFLIHILILVYVSLSLALLCDSYFVPALQIISKGLKIPDDVSGATLMAMGTSAPELFTSLIALFQGEEDIGTGTILGSALFNLVGVPAVCGMSIYFWGNRPSKVSPFPVVRDSIFYSITVLALYLTLKDNTIDLPESSVLILLYGIYIIIMYLNSRILNFISILSTASGKSDLFSLSGNSEVNEEKSFANEETGRVKVENLLSLGDKVTFSTEYSHNRYPDTEHRSSSPTYGSFKNDNTDQFDSDGEDEDVDWIIEIPFLKIFLAPINLIFSLTIPDHNKWTTIAFIMSSIYIGLLTYIAVWTVNLLGFTFGIPDAIAGVTIMAAASSVPELVSNVIIIKKTGKANTALSNAIGSNVFDILICLGIPWFIRIVINSLQNIKPTSIHLENRALPLTTLSILTAILGLLLILKLSRWRLGLSVGLMSTMVYIILTVLTCSLGVSM